ncbi:hypothetical protein [Hymenobacter rubripertinctus]|uniref:Uncharacterized protein n=1 Tax=Hymenobacter rubripertinctus TaxID=2029981 RepID=A0A418R8F2_9BACT|nr:hypothetical protein [Hymenobacter rubripertinctus]RIY13900.1 hypothetical protein D0T11_02125 [Hymenobacter rubripertinctus]
MPKNVQSVFLGLLLVGATAWLYGFFMPAFIAGKSLDDLPQLTYHLDPADKAEKLQSGRKTDFRKAYYAADKAWRTSRNTWLDTGSGVAISSLTVLLFLPAGRVRTLAQLRRQRTIRKTRFIVWLNLGWGLLYVSLNWYYHYRSGRFDYAPFADTIAIPLLYGQLALLVGWLLSNAVLLPALWPACLPALLFGRLPLDTWQARLVGAVLGFLILITILYAVLTIIDGDHLTIPVALLFVYLLLVLRAGYGRAFSNR